VAIPKTEFSSYIKRFRFKELFNYFGWDNDRTNIPIEIDGRIYNLVSVAQKSGFKIFTCDEHVNGRIPLYATRRKIDNRLTAYSHDHIIIYSNENKTEQLWQFIYKSSGQPQKVSEIRYNVNQDVERLYQRTSGLVFELDEEDKITIVDVTQRVKSNFGKNSEKVTKKFYDSFRKHHKAFLGFIKGIDDRFNKEWYASLMLNRLMFCYFIQKRGFLDENKNYLRDKLNECKSKNGEGKFYSFYRLFLLKLFHEGLGSCNRTDELCVEIGNIPYLNGSLFDVHEIERQYEGIDMADDAFEKVFDFFDEYDWHLDSRMTATGKEINPDVLGYIFEKYINDRARMGAYYTQEDITEYISRNCIIPYLFEETKRKYSGDAFDNEGFIWKWLKNSGDKYIFDAVKKGVKLKLPPEIEVGVDTESPDLLERRKNWNKPALDEYAQPTETWREVIERRQHYYDVKRKVELGQINSIDGFITNNLNIRLFLQDIIENIDDDNFIRIFYKVLSSVTILDPTCGSGAFLFAAMNILEPLYEATIMRMENYVEEGKAIGKRYKSFDYELYKLNNGHHPNRQYYIYKSIILNNLYGVDIMKEAVETAKLRLFLKLVASVDPNPYKDNMGLEPLPDIDFNIKSGNTLVGFANREEVENALCGSFDALEMRAEVKEKCDEYAKAVMRYKDIQLDYGENFNDFKESKEVLFKRQNSLNEMLDKRLFGEYRVTNYYKWRASHRPFHWYAEYYSIVELKGGFDVIIGNPPYVEYNKVKKTYRIKNYETAECGNLYAFIIERNDKLLKDNSYSGMIVPHSAFCTDRMAKLMNLYKNKSKWISTFDIRPSKLFNGVDQRLAIYITTKASVITYTTKYNRWKEEQRDTLFSNMRYSLQKNTFIPNCIIKNGHDITYSIINRIMSKIKLCMLDSGKYPLYYHNTPRYWIRATTFTPYFWNEKNGEKLSTQVRAIDFRDKVTRDFIICVLNSSLFYIWFLLFSDSRHLNKREIDWFPIKDGSFNSLDLTILVEELMEDYEENKCRKETYYQATGKVIYDEYFPKLSKHIIDKIDVLLAKYYGFTEEELDFIINYDIKYRMGSVTGDEKN